MIRSIHTLLSISIVMLLFVTANSCKQEAKGEESTSNEAETKEADPDIENETEEVLTQASPRKQASGQVDGITINIDYGSPSVKGRKIWGGLESYGKVWRAGANETTSIEISAAAKINGESIPAGKYGFFIIPMEEGKWIGVFNEEWSRELHGAWGAFSYKLEKDVLRVDVSPEWAKEVMETLEYKVTDSGFEFVWEKVRIKFEVQAE